MSLSVKDRFAAAAMQAIITKLGLVAIDRSHMAETAYDIAEAMCAERARRFTAHAEKADK